MKVIIEKHLAHEIRYSRLQTFIAKVDAIESTVVSLDKGSYYLVKYVDNRKH
jgi:hypothetical protein